MADRQAVAALLAASWGGAIFTSQTAEEVVGKLSIRQLEIIAAHSEDIKAGNGDFGKAVETVNFHYGCEVVAQYISLCCEPGYDGNRLGAVGSAVNHIFAREIAASNELAHLPTNSD